MLAERRALLLVNPRARRPPSSASLAAGTAWLRDRGWRIELRRPEHRAELISLAARAADTGYDCVIACGGDGTLHDALNGVVGSSTALALVPGGTANVWAHEAGLPGDPAAALRLVEEGVGLRLDTGLAAGQAFLLMASLGLDSLVVEQVGGRAKRRLGALAFLYQAALELLMFRGLGAEISVDGRTIRTPMLGLLLGNTRSYGGLLEITRHAVANDGLLDVCIYQGEGRRCFLRALLETIRGRHTDHPSVCYTTARRIDVVTDRVWPVQADGELIGRTPLTVTCVPRSVTVVVPRGRRSALWNSPGLRYEP